MDEMRSLLCSLAEELNNKNRMFVEPATRSGAARLANLLSGLAQRDEMPNGEVLSALTGTATKMLSRSRLLSMTIH